MRSDLVKTVQCCVWLINVYYTCVAGAQSIEASQGPTTNIKLIGRIYTPLRHQGLGQQTQFLPPCQRPSSVLLHGLLELQSVFITKKDNLRHQKGKVNGGLGNLTQNNSIYIISCRKYFLTYKHFDVRTTD